MRLRVGDKAPPLVAPTVTGESVSLENSKGKFTILSFHRYVGCQLCNVAVRSLNAKAPGLLASGLSIISVFESGDKSLEAALKIWGTFDFPLIADPQAKLFAAYGVETSLAGVARSVGRAGMLVDSLRIGTTKVPKDGTDLRMPAAFFIGPDLKIFDLHYGRDAGDHLTPEMMDRWLRVVQGDRRQPVSSSG
jgi:thioredoxin-dependent peroxiredoxin